MIFPKTREALISVSHLMILWRESLESLEFDPQNPNDGPDMQAILE